MISIDEEINLLEKRIVELQELKSLYEQLEKTENE
jgi:hypothetical protein